MRIIDSLLVKKSSLIHPASFRQEPPLAYAAVRVQPRSPLDCSEGVEAPLAGTADHALTALGKSAVQHSW